MFPAKAGIDVFRIFDSLNWVENMKMPIEEALKTGKIVEGTLCYTGDMLRIQTRQKYTLDYYVKKAKELEALGLSTPSAIKDMAGLAEAICGQRADRCAEVRTEDSGPPAYTMIPQATVLATVLMAAEAGVDIVDLAIESMSSLTSQPSMNCCC